MEKKRKERDTKIQKKSEFTFEDSPPVFSLQDLINIGNSYKFYKNIDSVMLWRMTPFLEELNKMIGMTSLKKTVFYQVIYYLQGMHKKNLNEEYLHTVIYGNPGCGKTTIAKIIGKIYQSMNILSDDCIFKVVGRDDFVAGYLGQTAIKTKKLLNSCIGGVLFIDEVYSLAPRDNDKDSFSKEAIDTLNGFLSEHKNDLCCIIAGYEEEVNGCFFAMNKGLERRFPWVHRIEEYTENELYLIFIKMLRDMKWECSVSEKELVQTLKINKKLFKNAGGDIETFLSKCKMIHSMRVFSLEDKEKKKFILTMEDIEKTIEFIKENNIKKEEVRFDMYT
jgi:SpoVK/Ycf46/Vps4 family AAA+-type ATPase